MSAILGAAIGGALITVGVVLKSRAKSDVELHEIAKYEHKALNIPEPSWQDNKSYYEASSKNQHLNANIALAVGLLVMLATIFN